jgi:chromosome segregation ATPase
MTTKNLFPISTVDIHGADKHDETVPSMKDLEDLSGTVENNRSSIEQNSTETETLNNKIESNSSSIEQHSRQITDLNGDVTTLEERVSDVENDISTINTQLQNLNQDSHSRMHGSEQHSSDELHNEMVIFPPMSDKAEAREKLSKRGAVYIRSENDIFWEDGT